MQRIPATRLVRGVTLVEVCIVLALIGIVAGFGTNSFGRVLARQTLIGMSANVASDIHFARSESVSRGQGVRVSVRQDGAGGSCLMIHTGAAADCACTSGAVPQCSAGTELIKSQSFPAAGELQVSASWGSMRFDPVNGTVSPTSTLRLQGRDGRAVHHVTNILGRVRTCSPRAAVAGQPAC